MFYPFPSQHKGFPHSSFAKESACNTRDLGSTPRSGRFPGEGNGNSLQYSCLENPMVREACQATIHRVARVGHDLGIIPPPPQHKMPQRLEILSCFYLWGKFCFSFWPLDGWWRLPELSSLFYWGPRLFSNLFMNFAITILRSSLLASYY